MNKPTNQFECIYLTLYDPQCEDEGPVWWCEDRIDDSDVEYVPRATLDALTERLEVGRITIDLRGIRLQACVERIAELEAAMRKVVSAGTTEPTYCPWCECPQCRAMPALIALLPEEPTMSKITCNNWHEYCEEPELTGAEQSELGRMCPILAETGDAFYYVTGRTMAEWDAAARPYRTYADLPACTDACRRLTRAELAAWREWQEIQEALDDTDD